jgi:chemotaxis methyl-accepting protein methylase
MSAVGGIARDETVATVATLLCDRAGLRGDRALHSRLVRCIAAAAEAAGRDVEDYVASLPGDAGALQQLVDRVTVQESSFFRDAAQFDILAEEVLPSLEAGVIWSAACANGQEPWTLAMVLDEQGRTDCSVLATDISVAALARAAEGRYAERELRGLSPQRRDRYFRKSGTHYEIDPSLRRLVTFGRHNLVARDLPLEASRCRVVFCRNVLIYLTDEEIIRVLDRLAQALMPAGLLFLGYSESLWRLPSRFSLRRIRDTFVYEAGGSAPPVAAPRPASPPAPAIPSRAPDRAAPPVTSERLLEEAGTALVEGDLAAAVVAFRKAAYQHPEDATIALHLAFALDAVGDGAAAKPWFRRALEGIEADPAAHVLDGWSPAEVRRLVQRKLSPPAGGS